MQTAFTDHGWEDYLYWQEHDAEVLSRINDPIKEIQHDPFRGKGKPEPLKGSLAGYWSRRVTEEHRLVYRVQGTGSNRLLVIIQARFHY